MRRWTRDWGLQARMLLTMLLLAAVYLFFLAFLAYQGAGFSTMILFVGIFLFIQYFFSDRLVLASMGAKIVSENEQPELHQMVSRLCAMADIPKPKIAVVRTPIPNAFATGRSPKNAVVAVTTGLVQTLNRQEVEAVVAHELSHIKNRDVMVMTIASFISTVASFLVQNMFFFGMGNRREDRDSGSLMVVWLVSMLVWAVSFLLIQALSRYREFAADRGSAIITGKPSHLASALMKISGIMPRMPKEDLRKVESMNAFFIIPARSGFSLQNLLSTHPNLEQRLAALEKIEQEMGL